MTTNESRIYGTLLILASLMVIALVVMGAPEREKAKCDGRNLDFVIEADRDTFRIGDHISIVSATNNADSYEWLVSELDSVVAGKSMREQNLVLVFTEEGQKTIRLRINDREDCTTDARRIFIMPHCSDNQRNGSETDVDCGGNCPPCNAIVSNPMTRSNTPPPVRRPTCYDGKQNGAETGIDCGGNCAPCIKHSFNNLPYANIVHIAGELKCNEYITFDCGIPNGYKPFWSFDDLRTKELSGKRVTHKITGPGSYMVRVYVNNTEVGQKRFEIAPCSGETPVVSPPVQPPPKVPARIVLPNRLNCKEMLTFRSTGAPSGSRLRWQVNGREQKGINLYQTFEEEGTYTVKLYTGSNYAPDDSRTFKINCENISSPPIEPINNIEVYNILKTRLQTITDEGAKDFRLVIKSGPKYQRILGDPSLCKGGKTIVKISNESEKSLDAYFEQIIKKQYVIKQVRIKKDGNCIEKILINHHKK